MPSILDELRLRNLVGPNSISAFGTPRNIGLQSSGLFQPQKPVIPPVIPISPTTPLNPPDTGIPQVKKSTTPGLDEYKSYLSSQPQRQDYQLNKWGKLLSGVAGVAEGHNRGVREGINVGMGLIQRPYTEAMEDWGTKGARLKELSELERTGRAEELERERFGLEKNKDLRDQMILAQQLKMGELEMQAKMQDIATGKIALVKGDDGWIYEHDPINRRMTKLQKIGEAPAETRAADHNYWEKRFSLTQFGQEELEKLKHRHDVVMAGINHGYAAELVKVKGQLDKELAQIDPRARTAAFQGAMNELLTMYPGMKSALFDIDNQGNVIAKVDPTTGEPIDPKAWNEFSNALHGKTREYLGTGSMMGLPWMNTPAEDIPLRIEAIDFIRENNLLPTQEQIRKAMEELRAEKAAKAAGGIPQVNAPSTNMGIISQGGRVPGVGAAIQNIIPNISGPPTTNQPLIPGVVNAPSEIPIQIPPNNNPVSPFGPNFGKLNPQFYQEMNRIPNAIRSPSVPRGRAGLLYEY